MIRKRLLPSIALALIVPGAILSGCGDSGGPNPKMEETRVNKAIEMRKLFDKAGGDYSKLDATDKASFDQMAGGDGQKAFDEMKNGPSSAPSTGPNQ